MIISAPLKILNSKLPLPVLTGLEKAKVRSSSLITLGGRHKYAAPVSTMASISTLRISLDLI